MTNTIEPVVTLEMINGKLTKTETLYYPSTGRISKRFYENISDNVPENVIIIAHGNIGKAPIEDNYMHPEAKLYEYFLR